MSSTGLAGRTTSAGKLSAATATSCERIALMPPWCRPSFTAILDDVLRPAVVSAVLDGVFEAAPDVVASTVERARAELVTIEREISRFVAALALGGDMAPVVAGAEGSTGASARATAHDRGSRGHASTRRSKGRRAAGTRAADAVACASTLGCGGWAPAVSRNPHRPDPVHAREGRDTDLSLRGRDRVRAVVSGIAGLAPAMASPTGFEPVFWP